MGERLINLLSTGLRKRDGEMTFEEGEGVEGNGGDEGGDGEERGREEGNQGEMFRLQ